MPNKWAKEAAQVQVERLSEFLTLVDFPGGGDEEALTDPGQCGS